MYSKMLFELLKILYGRLIVDYELERSKKKVMAENMY